MPSEMIASWGNVFRIEHDVRVVRDRFDSFPMEGVRSVLPFGNGRSYGDSCLNSLGTLLKMRGLDRFIAFDESCGVFSCESGVLLAEITALVLPKGWFLPVVPGTHFVTVGGAVANDVHGKNHHRVGTFGQIVRRFELLLSSGERLLCSRTENPEVFGATIGGLGLTGIITWVELQLRRASSAWMNVETFRFANLREFFASSAQAGEDFEYVVAWVDCIARGKELGRGILQCANHAAADPEDKAPDRARWSIVVSPPFSLVNTVSLRVFNTLYYHRHIGQRKRALQYYREFFFPLDSIAHWNRLYGPRGFHQYQCILPIAAAEEGIAALLKAVAGSGLGSFLAVLKQCGSKVSPGMLSFPMAGVTLALDFPNQVSRITPLFVKLDAVVAAAGGRLYPAKDGRMPAHLFKSGYPRWQEFSHYVDPRCSSDFWRRVTGSVA